MWLGLIKYSIQELEFCRTLIVLKNSKNMSKIVLFVFDTFCVFLKLGVLLKVIFMAQGGPLAFFCRHSYRVVFLKHYVGSYMDISIYGTLLSPKFSGQYFHLDFKVGGIVRF